MLNGVAGVLTEVWNMPAGIGSAFGGSFVVIGALVAWRSVLRQTSIQAEIEKKKREGERKTLELSLNAELMSYSSSVLQAASAWNARCRKEPNEVVLLGYPKFVTPQVYPTAVSKLGMLGGPWIAAAVITFYANLLELNEMALEAAASMNKTLREPKPRFDHPGETNSSIAERIALMSANLGWALEWLNPNRTLPIPNAVSTWTLVTRTPTDEYWRRSADTLPRLLRLLGGVRD